MKQDAVHERLVENWSATDTTTRDNAGSLARDYCCDCPQPITDISHLDDQSLQGRCGRFAFLVGFCCGIGLCLLVLVSSRDVCADALFLLVGSPCVGAAFGLCAQTFTIVVISLVEPASATGEKRTKQLMFGDLGSRERNRISSHQKEHIQAQLSAVTWASSKPRRIHWMIRARRISFDQTGLVESFTRGFAFFDLGHKDPRHLQLLRLNV
jgi:hypothetical protein